MSLYDSASLVMIPSGVKEDKLYSIKPTDGSGDFTFSRGSDIQATRVNASGLIEKAKVNLLLQSNSFDTTWATANASVTGGQSGYDGSSDAWLLTSTSTTNARVEQSNTGTGVQTFSVYAKAGTADFIRVMAQVTGSGVTWYSFFDLANGTIETNAFLIDKKIEDVGGGWYRCSITYNSTNIKVVLNACDADGSSAVTNGATILIQDAQLNHGLVAQDYVETTTTAVVEGLTADLPRLDYSGGASCPSLLLEPSRTNIQTNSEYVDAYVKSRSTITTNATTSPEGVINASKVIPLSTSTGWSGVNAPNHSFTSGDAYTLSVFAKAGEYNYCQVGGSIPAFNGSFATINLTNGVVEHESGITATTEDYGNGWWRISFTHTAIATASSPIGFFAVYSTAVSSRLATQVGDDTSGVYMYGWQAELGNYATSLIPTYGTAAVRGADEAIKTSATDLIGQTEGTLFLEFVRENDGVGVFSINTGNVGNRVYIGTDSNGLISQVRVSYSTQAFFSTLLTIGDTYKCAIAYKENDFVLYVNGTQIGADTNGLVPSSISTISSNGGTTGSDTFRQPIKQALLFKTRLTNAELASLTTI